MVLSWWMVVLTHGVWSCGSPRTERVGGVRCAKELCGRATFFFLFNQVYRSEPSTRTKPRPTWSPSAGTGEWGTQKGLNDALNT